MNLNNTCDFVNSSAHILYTAHLQCIQECRRLFSEEAIFESAQRILVQMPLAKFFVGGRSTFTQSVRWLTGLTRIPLIASHYVMLHHHEILFARIIGILNNRLYQPAYSQHHCGDFHGISFFHPAEARWQQSMSQYPANQRLPYIEHHARRRKVSASHRGSPLVDTLPQESASRRNQDGELQLECQKYVCLAEILAAPPYVDYSMMNFVR